MKDETKKKKKEVETEAPKIEEVMEDETEVKEEDPKPGMNMEQLKRVAHEGKGDHVHKLSNEMYTSGAIVLEDRPGHVHMYQLDSGKNKRTSISEESHDKHVHETEHGPTGLPE